MTRFCITVLLFFALCLSSEAQVFDLPNASQEEPVRFFLFNNQTWLATSRHLFQFEKKAWQVRWTSPDSIVTALAAGKYLWVGGKATLKALDLSRMPDPVVFQKQIPVTTIARGLEQTEVLIGSKDDARLYKDTSFAGILMASTWVNDICSCGSSVWIGTSAGLTRREPDGRTLIYAEEGVKGYEIPDNIVERLLCLHKGRLLAIVMPEALAFFDVSGKEAPTHPEHFDFLGEPGNAVFDMTELPKGAMLFATAKGGVLRVTMPEDAPHAKQPHEHGQRPVAERIYPEREIKGAGLEKQVWKLVFADKKKDVWLANAGKVIRIKK
jgi:hypothetical protein